jgi:predicted GNAT family acetyltransferase
VSVATTVVNAADSHRFEILVDGEVAGFAEYRSGPGVRAFVHTEIDDRFEGHGLGSQLVRAALDATRDEGLTIEPFCPFVLRFIKGHPEYIALINPDRRDQFAVEAAPAPDRPT